MAAQKQTRHILAIDQGTTSSRAIVFDSSGRPVATAQKELPQIFPKPGWVEHDPEEIWRATVEVCRGALAKAKLEARDLAGIGITNQRETTVVWDRATGKPVHNAIVWQDRRTSEHCAELKKAGHEKMVSEKTGLLLDPYFCATKIAWILKHVAGARAAADKGALAFGTIESFLLWRLTGGKIHVSDATNASRSLAARHPQGRVGSGAREASRRAAVDAAEGRRLRRRTWHRHRRHPGRAGTGAGHGRRPAGRDHRAGLHQARHGQGDLRHRLFRAA